MTVTVPTSEAQYGYVVGRVIRALGDTTDVDDKPDAVAATGKVTFTPKSSLGRTSDYSAFIVREKIDAPLDAQGNLVRYEGATPAGIALTVGAYRVEFTLNSGSIPGFDIEVTAGHTQAAPLDLVTAAPHVPPTGVTANTLLVPAGAVVGQVLGWSASGLDWVDMAGGGGAVSSVAGRAGDVVLSSADLTDAASLATDAELTAGLAGKANTSHSHTAANISDSTATGRTLMTAATATAARAAISAAPVLGADDNYVTDAEKAALHAHSNKAALDLVSGTNTGDQTLSGLGGAPASGQFATHTLTAAASVTLSADYPAQALAMTTDTTLVAPTVTDSTAIVFLLSGAFAPTWWAEIKWAGGTPATYASAGTLYHLLKLGASWFASGQAYS